MAQGGQHFTTATTQSEGKTSRDFVYNQDLTGKKIGKLTVKKKLRHNEFEDIYLVNHSESHQDVALHIFNPSLFASAEAKEEFIIENTQIEKMAYSDYVYYDHIRTKRGDVNAVTRILHGVSFDKIIDLYQANNREPKLKDISRLLTGKRSFGKSLLEKKFKNYTEFVCQTMLRVASQIVRIHEAGLIHGNLNLKNILINPRGEPTLTGFGFPKILTLHTESPSTISLHLAPEQIFKTSEPNQRSDIYSYGIVFYTMLTGRFPFVGADPRTLLAKIRGSNSVPLHIFPFPPDPELAVLVTKAIQTNPESRQKHMIELRLKLTEFVSKATWADKPAEIQARLQSKKWRAITLTVIGFFLFSLTIIFIAPKVAVYREQQAKKMAQKKENQNNQKSNSDSNNENSESFSVTKDNSKTDKEGSPIVVAGDSTQSLFTSGKKNWASFSILLLGGAIASTLIIFINMHYKISE